MINLGGGGMFNAKVERLMLSEVEELWDSGAIAICASRQAMIEMIQSEEYQAMHHHRDAGLAGQLPIETTDAAGIWPGGDRIDHSFSIQSDGGRPKADPVADEYVP